MTKHSYGDRSLSLLRKHPRGLLLVGFRLPILLYHARLGTLLGDRFLLLKHLGRKTGQLHETVVEIVKHESKPEAFYVVSGWGQKSDWYQNVRKHPEVIVKVGNRTLQAQTSDVPVVKAAAILEEYSQRYPLAFRELTSLFLGERLSGFEGAQRLAEMMPMVVFSIYS